MYIIRAMPHVATVGITNKIAVIFFIGLQTDLINLNTAIDIIVIITIIMNVSTYYHLI